MQQFGFKVRIPAGLFIITNSPCLVQRLDGLTATGLGLGGGHGVNIQKHPCVHHGAIQGRTDSFVDLFRLEGKDIRFIGSLRGQ